jgi:ribosome-associated translation inhibitor RaiA
MTETIQQLKEDIAILQEKLQKLEEQQRTKTPVEEAYKDWWGEYPGTENWTSDATRWQGFQAGYEFAYAISTAKEVMEKVQEEQEENEWKSVALRFGEKLSGYLSDGYYELSPSAWFRWAVFTYGKTQQVKEVVRESVKWCEEHPDKDPLDCLKPQTPEQTSQSLKEAFVKAQQTENWKEIQKKIDAPAEGIYDNIDVNKLLKKWEKDPPEFLKFELGQSLTNLIYDWWEDVFTTNSNDDMETSIENLVDRIDKWLPKSQSAAGSQSLGVEDMVEGFNDCLKKIKRKLR